MLNLFWASCQVHCEATIPNAWKSGAPSLDTTARDRHMRRVPCPTILTSHHKYFPIQPCQLPTSLPSFEILGKQAEHEQTSWSLHKPAPYFLQTSALMMLVTINSVIGMAPCPSTPHVPPEASSATIGSQCLQYCAFTTFPHSLVPAHWSSVHCSWRWMTAESECSRRGIPAMLFD